MNYFKNHWYKILSIFILLYVFIVGCLAPLKPGITQLSSSKAEQGKDFNVLIKGYNTHFKSNHSGNRVWLKIDSIFAIEAQKVNPLAEDELMAYFILPNFAPDSNKALPLGVMIDNDIDGHFERPSAVMFIQNSLYVNQGKMLWKEWPMNNLHESLAFRFPYRNILQESIRNTYFHVPMWFAMIILFFVSMVNSIKFLRKPNELYANYSYALIKSGFLFGIAGLLTGALWAKYTWGQYWSFDVKQNMSAISLMIYGALLILVSSIKDKNQSNRIAASYNIFAFATLIPLLFIIPRLTDSLHPGNGGNPAFGSGDLDNTMRMVFYPAVIGWTLLGFWIANLIYRIKKVGSSLDSKII